MIFKIKTQKVNLTEIYSPQQMKLQCRSILSSDKMWLTKQNLNMSISQNNSR